MSADFHLICDAEPVDGGFLPTVKILEGSRVALAWRGSFSFPHLSLALVYAHDYGAVAIEALRSGQP